MLLYTILHRYTMYRAPLAYACWYLVYRYYAVQYRSSWSPSSSLGKKTSFPRLSSVSSPDMASSSGAGRSARSI